MSDPYVDASGVLINMLSCTTTEDLARAEAAKVTLRDAQLQLDPLPGRFDLGHLRRVHAHLFGDVYSWAGQLRTVNIGKGVAFAASEYIEPQAKEVFDKLARRHHLRGLTPDDFVNALTDLLADVNALHPFREGNGRTQRAFLRQLGHEAGFEIDWTAVEAGENDHCSLRSLIGDYEPMRSMLRRIVRPVA